MRDAFDEASKKLAAEGISDGNAKIAMKEENSSGGFRNEIDQSCGERLEIGPWSARRRAADSGPEGNGQ